MSQSLCVCGLFEAYIQGQDVSREEFDVFWTHDVYLGSRRDVTHVLCGKSVPRGSSSECGAPKAVVVIR